MCISVMYNMYGGIAVLVWQVNIDIIPVPVYLYLSLYLYLVYL